MGQYDKNSNVDNIYRTAAKNLAKAIEIEFNTKVYDYGVLDKGSPNFKDILPFMVTPPENAKVIFYFLVPINDADVVITNDYYNGNQYSSKTDWDISNFLQSKVNSTVYDFGALRIDKYSGDENTVPNANKIEGLRYRFFRFFAV